MSAQAIDLAVTAVGMVSSLGLDAVTGCAAARAGVVRPTVRVGLAVQAGDTAEQVEVHVHRVPTIADGFTGLGRLAQLGGAALADLRRSAAFGDGRRTGLLVNVPSGSYHTAWERRREMEEGIELAVDGQYEMEWRREDYAARLLPTLTRLAELEVDPAHQAILFEDQTGLASMLLRAAGWFAAGQIDRCLIGGIGSHLEPYLLEALLGLHMVKTPAQADGFMPGEGAAFLLVEPSSRTEQKAALGAIEAVSLSAESSDCFTSDLPRGEALARATDAVLRASVLAPDVVIGDVNGEAWRAADWGYALSRLHAEYAADLDRPAVYPAGSFGDTGAVAGPVAVALALHLFQRTNDTNRALLCLAAESGARAAVTLHAASA